MSIIVESQWLLLASLLNLSIKLGTQSNIPAIRNVIDWCTEVGHSDQFKKEPNVTEGTSSSSSIDRIEWTADVLDVDRFPRIGAHLMNCMGNGFTKIKEYMAFGILHLLNSEIGSSDKSNNSTFWRCELQSLYDFAARQRSLLLFEKLYTLIQFRLAQDPSNSGINDACLFLAEQLPLLPSVPKRSLWDMFSIPARSDFCPLSFPSVERLLSPSPVILSSRLPVPLNKPSLWRLSVHQPCAFEVDVMKSSKIAAIREGRRRVAHPTSKQVMINSDCLLIIIN